MKFYFKSLIIVLVLVLSLSPGCSFFSNKKRIASLKPATFIHAGNMIDKNALSKGGKVLVLPFKAGEGVEANEAFDKSCLMIIKGVADSFGGNQKHSLDFEAIFSDPGDIADFILEGYITRLEYPSFFRRWVLMDKTINVEVKGQIKRCQSEKVVIVFVDKMKIESSREKYLGKTIGKNIGNFILSAGNTNYIK